MQDEWFLRTQQEVNDVLSHDGISVFSTLTYNMEHLPHFDNDEKQLSCWSYRHQRKFIDFINKRLERAVPNFTYGIDFRYAIFPERGSDDVYISDSGMLRKGTLRPHYHIILNFTKKVVDVIGRSEEVYKEMVESGWTQKEKRQVKVNYVTPVKKIKKTKYVTKSVPVPLGKVRWSDAPKGCLSGVFITRETAALYASKYAVKDLDFYYDNRFIEFRSKKMEELGLSKAQFYEKYKGCMPRHHQSNMFGIGLMDVVKRNGIDSLVTGHDFQFSFELEKGKSVVHQFPKYIKNKFLTEKKYDFLENEFIVPNDLAKDLRKKFLDKKIENLEKQLYVNIYGEKAHLYNFEGSYFNSLQDWQDYIDNLLSSRSLYLLAKYCIFARGQFVSTDLYEVFSTMPESELFDNLEERYILQLDRPYEQNVLYNDIGYLPSLKKKQQAKNLDLENSSLFLNNRFLDLLPIFSGFNLIIDSINYFYNNYRKQKHLSYLQERKERKYRNRLLYNFKHQIYV